MAPWWSVSSLTTSSVAVDVRCIRCHKKMSPPTERWPVWRCAHCWTEWTGPSESVPLHTRASRVEDDGKDDLRTAPHAGAGPKTTVSGPHAHQPEEGNGPVVVAGKSGALLLVEWKPERGLYVLSGGSAESESAH